MSRGFRDRDRVRDWDRDRRDRDRQWGGGSLHRPGPDYRGSREADWGRSGPRGDEWRERDWEARDRERQRERERERERQRDRERGRDRDRPRERDDERDRDRDRLRERDEGRRRDVEMQRRPSDLGGDLEGASPQTLSAGQSPVVRAEEGTTVPGANVKVERDAEGRRIRSRSPASGKGEANLRA